MQFVESSTAGTYRLAEPYGVELARAARYRARSLSAVDMQLLSVGLLRCPPTAGLLQLFVPDAMQVDLTTLRESGRPLYLSTVARKEVVFSDGEKEVHRYLGEAEFRKIRWGALPLCVDLRVLDELKIQPTSRIPKGKNHVIFPTRDHSRTDVAQFRELVLGLVEGLSSDSGRVPIPELMYHVCIQHGMNTHTFRQLLRDLADSYPTEFYFEKVPLTAIARFTRSYLELGGVWRSAIMVSR